MIFIVFLLVWAFSRGPVQSSRSAEGLMLCPFATLIAQIGFSDPRYNQALWHFIHAWSSEIRLACSGQACGAHAGQPRSPDHGGAGAARAG
jgi:hypothetical protein